MGAIAVGPRTGRFKRNDATGAVEDHRESGHSIVLATIGTFLLCFGWFGFNSGSTFGLSNGLYLVAGNAAVNSLLAIGSSGLTIAAWSVWFTKTHDMNELLNGILCDLVAITPACATVEPWGAILVGAASILVYRAGVRFVAWCHIDDVVDAFAVHGCCGSFGVLATGLLSTQANCDAAFGVGVVKYSPGHQLGVQLLAVVAVAAFVSASSLSLFLVIKHTVGLRVSEADERVGQCTTHVAEAQTVTVSRSLVLDWSVCSQTFFSRGVAHLDIFAFFFCCLPGLDFKYHAGYAYAGFNDRVKKAHEQISMEAEIATQVRKAVAAGRGARFRDALAMPVSMFDSAAGMAAQAEAQQKAAAAAAAVANGMTSSNGAAVANCYTAPSSGNKMAVTMSSNLGGPHLLERGASIGPATASRGLRLNRTRATSNVNGSALPPQHNNTTATNANMATGAASTGSSAGAVISPRTPAYSNRDTVVNMTAGSAQVAMGPLNPQQQQHQQQHERAASDEI